MQKRWTPKTRTSQVAPTQPVKRMDTFYPWTVGILNTYTNEQCNNLAKALSGMDILNTDSKSLTHIVQKNLCTTQEESEFVADMLRESAKEQDKNKVA